MELKTSPVIKTAKNFLVEVSYPGETPFQTMITAPKISDARKLAERMFLMCRVKIIKEV
jgi:hypothetical protein